MISGMLRECEDRTHEILVRVPAGLRSQLVFRGVFPDGAEPEPRYDVTFHWCADVFRYLAISPSVARVSGVVTTFKGALKATTRRRVYYCVTEGREVLHYSWVTLGRCRHYRVEPSAAVIGPIWTSPNARGKGIATFATLRVIHEASQLGNSVVYIDTSCDNAPCLKVIEKCGFGPPIATYIRS